MKVSELMVKEIVTCKDTAALGEVAGLMWEHDIGFVPVLSSEGALVGVVTDRDGFIASYFQGKPLWEIPVKQAMSTRVASIPPDAETGEAETVMSEWQVHRLPVVTKEGKLVGVVSLNDLARRAASETNEEFEEQVALTLGAICQPRTPDPRTSA